VHSLWRDCLKQVVIFDFDGVILDSMPIKTYAFREIFKDFDAVAVERLAKFHVQNGGISRFVKIRYFFENILGRSVNESEVSRYADSFAKIVVDELVKPKYLETETINFIKSLYGSKKLFVASGAEQNELRYLCKKFGIDRYFDGIFGSPTPKLELLKIILNASGVAADKCVMIGDSINDYEAAFENEIPFYGYNNEELKKVGTYINNFKEFSFD
jgi:HAD superfamily hydrolase (TIGR01549 family)